LNEKAEYVDRILRQILAEQNEIEPDLKKALDYFGIDVRDLVALDAGISTGGFTDCLLQHGVRKVYGIDVGYGQVHEK
jgi:predicted rRNA methylase YqxC with S4 and FtsJ domains